MEKASNFRPYVFTSLIVKIETIHDTKRFNLDPLHHGFWRFGTDGNLYMFGKKTVHTPFIKRI